MTGRGQGAGNRLGGVGVVNTIFPAQPSKFSEVESQIQTMLKEQKAAVMAEQKMREFEKEPARTARTW